MIGKFVDIFKKTKPTPEQALNGLSIFLDVVRENRRISEEEETKRENIRSYKEYELEKIRTQKEVLKDYFDKTFSERRNNFDKMFNALDKGIENNNIELIQMSLTSIVEVAKDSPLKQIENLKNDFHNPDIKQIEI